MLWLIGDKGTLGAAVAGCLVSAGTPFVGTDREVDIASETVLGSFTTFQAQKGAPVDWIINCAAYTAVDKAEDDRELCRVLNVEGPRNIARVARKIGARFLHVSTDYVFHGDGTRPYRESDPTDPTGYYGLTKRDGELAALAECENTWIIRTAWLYGTYGNNFPFTMLRLMGERESVSVVNDQHGSPTYAGDLAEAMSRLISVGGSGQAAPGIYHFSNLGEITWFDFAREIYRLGREKGILNRDCAVNPCASAEFPAKVRRPPYSVLDKTKICAALSAADATYAIPSWDASLAKFIDVVAKGTN